MVDVHVDGGAFQWAWAHHCTWLARHAHAICDGEAMPDHMCVSASCELVGCSKPGSLMTLRYTHNPACGWDLLADPESPSASLPVHA